VLYQARCRRVWQHRVPGSALERLFEGSLKDAMLKHQPHADLTIWALAKVDEALCSPLILDSLAFDAVMDFVELRGGEEYFLGQYVVSKSDK
jgi:hypothetical protein